jgi:hypothetical protein
MKTLNRLLIALFLSLLAFSYSNSQTGGLGWPPSSSPTTGESIQGGVFVSTNGGFSIAITQMPSKTIDMPSANSEVIGKQFAWVFERTLYTAMYRIDPEGNPLPQSYIDIEHGTEKAVLANGGKIISEKPIKYGDYGGIEFRYVSAQGVHYINRAYIVGDFGFQIVGGYADEKDEKGVMDVLDSFKILKHSKAIQSAGNKPLVEVKLSPIPSLQEIDSKNDLEPHTKKVQFNLPFAMAEYAPPTKAMPSQLQYRWQLNEGIVVVMTIITDPTRRFSKLPIVERKKLLTDFLENSLKSIGAQRISERDMSKGAIVGKELIVSRRTRDIVITRAFISGDMYVAISASILQMDKEDQVSKLFDSIAFVN